MDELTRKMRSYATDMDDCDERHSTFTKAWEVLSERFGTNVAHSWMFDANSHLRNGAPIWFIRYAPRPQLPLVVKLAQEFASLTSV